MKKFLLMFTAIFAGMGLIGCGNEGASSDKVAKGDDGRVEIKLWLDKDVYAEALIPKIEEALPHIKIVHENVALGDASNKLELDGPAGLGGDVIFHTQESMAKAFQTNVLLPLGEDLTTFVNDRSLPGTLNSVIYQDTLYGVPISVESLALFYNKTLLEENGLELATSFEQIIEEAKTYNDFKANKFLLRFEPWNTYTANMFLTAAGFELFGPNGDNPELINLDTQAVIDGLTMFKQLQEILPIPSKELSWDTVFGEFAKGTVPYMINGPWAIEEARQMAQLNGFEFGVTTIPTINGVQPQPFLGNITATISAYTKHPKEAREVLEFIGSDAGLQVMYDTTGRLPALKDVSVIEGVTEDPYLMGANDQVKIAKPMPMLGELNYYYEVGDIMFQSVWDGLSTPEVAAEKAMRDYKNTLEITK
ncbi:MAG: maltose ABC transporter substrate-binding protein [Turicibacter sp.]